MQKHDRTPEEVQVLVQQRARARLMATLHVHIAAINQDIAALWRLDPTTVLDGVLTLHLGTYQFPPRLAYTPKRGRYARRRKDGMADAGE